MLTIILWFVKEVHILYFLRSNSFTSRLIHTLSYRFSKSLLLDLKFCFLYGLHA